MGSRNASTGFKSDIRRELELGLHERRKSSRYVPVLDCAVLGCWEGEEFRAAPVRILNVSVGGAALLLDGAPPRTSTVWVFLPGHDTPSWIAADLVATESTTGGPPVVRLAFVEPLSYELFRTVVCGFPEEERPRKSITVDEPTELKSAAT